MEKLIFSTAGIPIRAKDGGYEAAFQALTEMKLGGMELEFTHGVSMSNKTQELVKRLSKEKNIELTAHGPYYINLNALEEDKCHASIKRILDTARVCHACGGYSITFHAGFYMKMQEEYVYKKIKTAMEDIVETLKSENIDIWIRPELTGKASQWGNLDEVIRLSKDVDMVLPCIDFAHLHARNGGKWNTYDEFCKVFEKIGAELGENALKNFHAHVAGIEYTAKGEKRHLNLKDSDLNYKDLMKAFKKFDIKGVVVCESPNIEDDAMLLQKTIHSL